MCENNTALLRNPSLVPFVYVTIMVSWASRYDKQAGLICDICIQPISLKGLIKLNCYGKYPHVSLDQIFIQQLPQMSVCYHKNSQNSSFLSTT